MKKTLKLFIMSFMALLSCAACSKGPEKYLSHRLKESDKRYPSYLTAINLLTERGAKTIVETGTARYGKKEFVGDGGSTIIFADWAKDHGAHLHSVDISQEAVKKALSATKKWGKFRDVVCSDSVAFLEKFRQPIDFLYLDSYDFEANDPLPSQQHHLKEIIAAYPHLHQNSCVMIDDCGLPFGGKGVLVINYLKERGWRMVYDGYQVIMTPSRDSRLSLK